MVNTKRKDQLERAVHGLAPSWWQRWMDEPLASLVSVLLTVGAGATVWFGVVDPKVAQTAGGLISAGLLALVAIGFTAGVSAVSELASAPLADAKAAGRAMATMWLNTRHAFAAVVLALAASVVALVPGVEFLAGATVGAAFSVLFRSYLLARDYWNTAITIASSQVGLKQLAQGASLDSQVAPLAEREKESEGRREL